MSNAIVATGTPTVEKLKLIHLVPFNAHKDRPSQLFGGVRLEDLADSISRRGLQNPIIVRKMDKGKFQILSGHNRVEALKSLGEVTVDAIVHRNLADEKAMEIYFDTNLNQQSFKDWNYAQRFDAVRYADRLAKEKSEQGKRNDMVKDNNMSDETCVQNRPRSKGKTKNPTTRDKMSTKLGLSTATFSKFRSIIRLEERNDGIIENAVAILSEHLDSKRLSFETAYRISQMKSKDIKTVLEWIVNNPEATLKGEESDMKFKMLAKESKDSEDGLSVERISEVLTKPLETKDQSS